MKVWINLIAIAIGFLLVSLVSRVLESDRDDAQQTHPESGAETGTGRASTRPLARDAVESLHHTLGFQQDLSHSEARKAVDTGGASPLRSQSFLNYRIHFLSIEQLREELAAGDFRTKRDAIVAAQRLAEYNLEEALELYCSRQWNLTLDNLYAFRNELTRIAVAKDAVMILRALQSLKRGGGQMDWALWMSREWSNKKPDEAARYFDELVRLRNVKMGRYVGDHLSGPDYQTYARMIVKSWHAKNPNELTHFINNLPAGPQRDAFADSLTKIKQPSP